MLAGLPAALRNRGHSVAIVVPMYQSMRRGTIEWKDTGLRYTIPVGYEKYHAVIRQGCTSDEVRLFAIDEPRLFERRGLYGDRYGTYPDNVVRFIFFSKAVAALSQLVSPKPEILHLNDWHCALTPVYVRHLNFQVATVLTIHNLAYQGIFPAKDFNLLGLPDIYFSPDVLEYYGKLNFMKGGIVTADSVTTVSPTYAQEIQKQAEGCGLDGVLRQYQNKLHGIINGIDTETWNPDTDTYLPETYASHALAGKVYCKRYLLDKMRLDASSVKDTPLLGMIARLVEQKGVELLRSIMDDLLGLGVRLIVLGQGEAMYERYFEKLARDHPRQIAVKMGFDTELSHQIEAGADFFLMPSRFEPCGLNQLYSQRYGTVPIVHATGGLEDTVDDWNEKTATGNGLKFYEYTGEALFRQVLRGIRLRRNNEQWQTIRVNAMRRDFSWSSRAGAYEEIYQKLLKTSKDA